MISIKATDEKNKEILATLSQMIAVRSYLLSIYNTKFSDRGLYKRIDTKIKILDRDILNLSLVVDSPFVIEDDGITEP